MSKSIILILLIFVTGYVIWFRKQFPQLRTYKDTWKFFVKYYRRVVFIVRSPGYAKRLYDRIGTLNIFFPILGGVLGALIDAKDGWPYYGTGFGFFIQSLIAFREVTLTTNAWFVSIIHQSKRHPVSHKVADVASNLDTLNCIQTNREPTYVSDLQMGDIITYDKVHYYICRIKKIAGQIVLNDGMIANDYIWTLMNLDTHETSSIRIEHHQMNLRLSNPDEIAFLNYVCSVEVEIV